MGGLPEYTRAFPAQQQEVWRQCRHATGTFIPFLLSMAYAARECILNGAVAQ